MILWTCFLVVDSSSLSLLEIKGYKIHIRIKFSQTEKHVSYCRYHKMDIDLFCQYLNNILFVLSPDANASEYNQYVASLTYALNKHVPVISRMEKRQPTG